MALVTRDPVFSRLPRRKNIGRDTSFSSSQALLATSSVPAVPRASQQIASAPQRKKRLYSETSTSSSPLLVFDYVSVASAVIEFLPAPRRKRVYSETSLSTPRTLFTLDGISGSFAVTNANDTLASSGTTTIVGTFSRTNAGDGMSAQGFTTVVGTLARTNTDDTLVASGSGGSGISGSLNATNGNDTMVASGNTTIVSSFGKTELPDLLAGVGVTIIIGTLARTNANDTLSASGTSGTPVVGVTTYLTLTGAGQA